MSERSKRKQSNNTETMDNNDVAGLMKKIEKIEESISENNSNLKSTIKDLMVELKDDLVKSVERKIEVIECALHDALKENESLKEELKKCEHEVNENHRRTRELGNLIINQSGQINEMAQYSRRNNLRISGIPEEQKAETAEETTKKVVKMLNENIEDLNLNLADIDISHRLGKRYPTGHRQIIVKFISRHNRDRVIRNRKVFKEKKIFINEDLTKLNQTVLTTIRTTTPENETAWSWDGKLYHKTGHGQINVVPFDDYTSWLGDSWDVNLLNGARYIN